MTERECPPTVRRGRLIKAEGFLKAAAEAQVLDDEGALNDAVVTLYVHAGIAAADVICCARLGRHSTGDDHSAAVALLQRAGSASAPRSSVLLGMKTKAGYSHTPATSADATKAKRAAEHLVEAARALAAGP